MLEDTMGANPNTCGPASACVLPSTDFWSRTYWNEANANAEVLSFINHESFLVCKNYHSVD